ncbi:CsbD family protein [Lederbergia citrea]|uniref:CsbD family protein n=1 Tax=Lederbergia citrea TaxID=2833581 RepID=A0A942UPC0_9BACI|nr:CsbD family protein [Lederbergia citrea]MBS4178625.1 CsbD family protein [Lederbergia citrea]MBS4205312.1 CsbD family protein [Lederbergia citrea]MBS4224375.1 CsbD family protein [Lederbergia citrea]
MSNNHGNKEKLEGTWDKVKGEAKDSFGDMTDNERMQAEGKWDKAKGEAKQKYGEAKKEVSDFFDKD